jgi:hypothetical protein
MIKYSILFEKVLKVQIKLRITCGARAKKQLFPQNGVCAFARAFCGMCCLCGGVALLIPLSLVFVRGEKNKISS